MSLDQIVSSIDIEPYYQEKEGVLYCEDCLKILSHIPKGGMDLVFADPPFNLGKEYEEEMESDVYFGWCRRWIWETWKCLNSYGSFFLMTIQEYVGKMMEYLEVSGDFRNQIIWHNASMPIKNRFCIGYQPILYYVKNVNDYTFNYGVEKRTSTAVIPWGRENKAHSIKDIWDDIPFVSGGCMASKEAFLKEESKGKLHPAQMPLRLAERIIKYCSNPDHIILAPFVGSGTTIVEAKKLGRYWIGIDIEKKYCDLSISRLKKEKFGSELKEQESRRELDEWFE